MESSPEHFPFICLILIASGKDFALGLAYQLQAKLPTRLRRPADCTNTHTHAMQGVLYMLEALWKKFGKKHSWQSIKSSDNKIA